MANQQFLIAVAKAHRVSGQANVCRALANAVRKRNKRDAERLDRHAVAIEDAAVEDLMDAIGYGDHRIQARK